MPKLTIDPAKPGSDVTILHGRCECGAEFTVRYAPTIVCPGCGQVINVEPKPA